MPERWNKILLCAAYGALCSLFFLLLRINSGLFCWKRSVFKCCLVVFFSFIYLQSHEYDEIISDNNGKVDG